MSAFEVASVILFSVTISSKDIKLSKKLIIVGFTRLLSLLSFSFITTKDDPSTNINSLTLYFISTCLRMYLISKNVQPKMTHIKDLRKRYFYLYMLCLAAITVFLYKHKKERMNYAFSFSSLLQWVLLLLDIGFDSTLSIDLKNIVFEMNLGNGPGLNKRLDKHVV